jgi:hypothetical protein
MNMLRSLSVSSGGKPRTGGRRPLVFIHAVCERLNIGHRRPRLRTHRTSHLICLQHAAQLVRRVLPLDSGDRFRCRLWRRRRRMNGSVHSTFRHRQTPTELGVSRLMMMLFSRIRAHRPHPPHKSKPETAKIKGDPKSFLLLRYSVPLGGAGGTLRGAGNGAG